MADAPLVTDLVDPADEDWTQADDGELWHAAQAQIPEAIAEMARRDREGDPGPAVRTGPSATELRTALRRRR